MEFTGVYRKTSEQMSYSLNENELIVNDYIYERVGEPTIPSRKRS